MRIGLNLNGLTLGPDAARRVDLRIRTALGSYVSEVLRLHVTFRAAEACVVCEMRATLRGRRVLQIASEGRDVDRALELAAARTGARVARDFRLRRLLRS